MQMFCQEQEQKQEEQVVKSLSKNRLIRTPRKRTKKGVDLQCNAFTSLVQFMAIDKGVLGGAEAPPNISIT